MKREYGKELLALLVSWTRDISHAEAMADAPEEVSKSWQYLAEEMLGYMKQEMEHHTKARTERN